jgi:hypothetical protein
MEIKNYALWLIPSGDSYGSLGETIRHYSDRFATPCFEPHITLVSSIQGSQCEIREKAANIAGCLDRFEFALGRARHSNSFFHCVFLDVILDAGLSRAHDIARGVFPVMGPDLYMPHVSLVYGNLPVEERDAIVEDIGGAFCGRILVQDICLYLASSDMPPDTWHEIQRYSLGK